MSAPEPGAGSAGVWLGTIATRIVELCTLRGRDAALGGIASDCGLALPALGRITAVPPDSAPGEADPRPFRGAALCVRPGRWMLLVDAAATRSVEHLGSAAAGLGVTIDLSSALAALHLSGPASREMLARGCRLDLDPAQFPAGAAAATHMAQVSVIIAALPAGILLLTPSSTARHVREWLAATAQPFGITRSPGSPGAGDLFGPGH